MFDGFYFLLVILVLHWFETVDFSGVLCICLIYEMLLLFFNSFYYFVKRFINIYKLSLVHRFYILCCFWNLRIKIRRTLLGWNQKWLEVFDWGFEIVGQLVYFYEFVGAMVLIDAFKTNSALTKLTKICYLFVMDQTIDY